MLDAAHGEGVGTVEIVHRIDVARIQSETARIARACIIRSCRPTPAARADARHGSRRVVAEARSISLKSNRWNE